MRPGGFEPSTTRSKKVERYKLYGPFVQKVKDVGFLTADYSILETGIKNIFAFVQMFLVIKKGSEYLLH